MSEFFDAAATAAAVTAASCFFVRFLGDGSLFEVLRFFSGRSVAALVARSLPAVAFEEAVAASVSSFVDFLRAWAVALVGATALGVYVYAAFNRA